MPQNHDRGWDFNIHAFNSRLDIRDEDVRFIHELIEENTPGLLAQIQVECKIVDICDHHFILMIQSIIIEKISFTGIFGEKCIQSYFG